MNLPRSPMLCKRDLTDSALIALLSCQQPAYLLMSHPMYHFCPLPSPPSQKAVLKFLHGHLQAQVPNTGWGALHQVGIHICVGLCQTLQWLLVPLMNATLLPPIVSPSILPKSFMWVRTTPQKAVYSSVFCWINSRCRECHYIHISFLGNFPRVQNVICMPMLKIEN
jgi:hypothetical protein